jgi:hypothetical protein
MASYSELSINIMDKPNEKAKINISENTGGVMEKTNEKTNEKIPFWSENPNILLNPEYISEFFPTEDMTYNQKLNSITRTVIVLTIIGLLYSYSLRIIVVSVLSILSIFVLHHYKKGRGETENFEDPALEILKNSANDLKNMTVFDTPTSLNPLSNVLMTDYDYNPEKKPAPPAFNQNTQDAILENAKQLVMEANPDQPDIADKLFRSLGDQLVFEQSMQPFVSNPATTIPNDQAAFAEFCYGSMISCKEGNKFACARNLDRHTN